jgi:N-acetylated-alpha-linked acidic dipeptidase
MTIESTMTSTDMRLFLDEVSLEAPWELTELFATLPRCEPQDVNASCDALVERLARHDVPVEVLMSELYLSIPGEAQVRTAAGALRAKPSAFSRHVPEGLEAELVYVPAAYSKSISTLFQRNFDGSASSRERIQGRIVVSEGYATPQKMREFEQAGAVGVVAINPGRDIHWGICTTIWGAPELDDLHRKPRIPVLAVNHEDGQRLIALAAQAQSATLVTQLQEGWFAQKLPVVTIPGNSGSDDFVLLHGHYDSWDVGVGDNATGDATLLEIARVLWKHRRHLERSVRIAWWPGHSTGRYAGSTWFADHFAADLDAHCVAQINCDSPGCRWATEYRNVSWMKETEVYAQAIIEQVAGLPSHGERPHRAGDYSFNNIGISSLMMLSSTMPQALAAEKGYYAVGGCGGNIAWHTENDTLEIADREVMLRDIRVYLGLVLGIANARILPFDWRATTQEFQETLARCQVAVGSAYSLSASREALLQLDGALQHFQQAVQDQAIPAAVANDAIRRLARILVPINNTLQPRFGHDAASAMPALPGLDVANRWPTLPQELQGFALTQIRRGENKLLAALRQARRELQLVLPN